MKAILFVSAFIVLVGGSYGQQISTQNETAYCIKLSVTNQLQFDFRVDLKNDTQGAMTALNLDSSKVTSGCTITYNSTQKVYSVRSIINLSNNQPVSNGCGFSVDSTNTVFTWRIKYTQNPNNFPNADGGLNRMYTSACNITSLPDDTETAAITPNTPNIDVVVNITTPPVNLVVLYEIAVGSGNFQPVTSSTPSLPIGTKLKLQLQVAFGTFDRHYCYASACDSGALVQYLVSAHQPTSQSEIPGSFEMTSGGSTSDLASKIYGAGGLRVRAAGNINFNNAIIFFNTTGCPSSNYAPSTSFGFQGPTTNTVSSPFLATTAEFLAWKFDDSNTLYFEVNYDTCRADTYNADLFCRDSCNNPRTSNGRRRRDVEVELEDSTEIVSVRIYDPDEAESSQQTNSDRTMLYVGMGVGMFALLSLLTILVCFLVIRARRQQEVDESKKVPPEGYINHVAY